MCSCDGVSRVWMSSPMTPSIAAATTDRACTSSPTLVRSLNTGASHECRIGRAGSPYPVTHESRERGPGPQPAHAEPVTSYRLADSLAQRRAEIVRQAVDGEQLRQQ